VIEEFLWFGSFVGLFPPGWAAWSHRRGRQKDAEKEVTQAGISGK